MLGTFKYKRGSGGWTVLYTAPNTTGATTLCGIERTEEGWVVPLAAREPLGPFKTRYDAGRAYLNHRNLPVLEAEEKALHARWRRNREFRRTLPLTAEAANAIWDILVADCGASTYKNDRSYFVHSHTKLRTLDTHEFRFFCGRLGFGGKFWCAPEKWYVSCYSENENVETRRMMVDANTKLQDLFERHSGTEA